MNRFLEQNHLIALRTDTRAFRWGTQRAVPNHAVGQVGQLRVEEDNYCGKSRAVQSERVGAHLQPPADREGRQGRAVIRGLGVWVLSQHELPRIAHLHAHEYKLTERRPAARRHLKLSFLALGPRKNARKYLLVDAEHHVERPRPPILHVPALHLLGGHALLDCRRYVVQVQTQAVAVEKLCEAQKVVLLVLGLSEGAVLPRHLLNKTLLEVEVHVVRMERVQNSVALTVEDLIMI
jgi:hypothetical protein